MVAMKTPLYDEHVKLGAKMTEFGGWDMPIQYEGLIPEHEAVRNEAGLFDVSHMGAVYVEGKDSEAFLNYLLTNNIGAMKNNDVMYTLMCYENGGTVDDFLVYKYNTEKYLLVVNASNIEKDFAWIKEQKGDYDIEIRNDSYDVGIVALQGPKAQEILQKLTDFDLTSIKQFTFADNVVIDGVNALVSRTGYTGEDGFEIYTTNEDIVKVWDRILEAGKDLGVVPTGLGCRDTLRFEAGLPLYGNEMTQDISPIEAGLKFFVSFDKEEDYIGRKVLEEQYNGGLTRRSVGFELIERGIPRQGYEVEKDGKIIGFVTTGYMSPTLNKSIGAAIVDIAEAKLGNEFDIVARGRKIKAKTAKKRFLNEVK